MSKFMELIKQVVEQGIPVTLNWNSAYETMYADLNFDAKSHGHLYELVGGSLVVEMRYGAVKEVEDLESLMYCFKKALHERDYGNQNWFDLCEKHGILEKVVETKTTYR